MELSQIHSRASAGIAAPLVNVETHLANGLPAFHIVGLPETAVRESKDRVRCAIQNSHFEFPDRRITVNLAPADLPKEGGRFDLPIALGILVASGQLPADILGQHEFVGELALAGDLRPVPGVIPAAQACTKAGRTLVTAAASAALAAVVPASRVIPAADLLQLCAHLNGNHPLPPAAAPLIRQEDIHYPDLADVVGQECARRALEIAASGGHNLLFCGPPGTGKTLLASRLPGILPPPDPHEALTCAALHSLHDSTSLAHLHQRPFRAPHHSASAAALVGGGARPRPGEVSLAHGGVLFLDELPEFSRQVLEVLREPMEAAAITLSRASHKFTYPARFQLVAAMNPCPCGYQDDPQRHCRCTPEQILRYRQRISGPLLDRIDLHVGVPRLAASTLLQPVTDNESSAAVQARVSRTRERQLQRQACSNAELAEPRLSAVCNLRPAARRHLEQAATNMKLSGRGLHRSLRVARTLADMAEEEQIAVAHIAEALAFRQEEANP
ncbi:YifB family Mg chelatase-like AAA ATPase [Kineobactrum salinum]|uniref:YifB family Mg chelatase-like AAA ATPase n=1 Tax=Kineobactrum salinum TaxID=2708301 RepID=A0A6C0TZR0_9GAMM|nr:YifB family Mg chelatase-like AAA ATPase [Kineobactrum salinum]QIB65271.1 YifB family Mg chelatase-like AAA ATPase [Kineobactrum salinum]